MYMMFGLPDRNYWVRMPESAILIPRHHTFHQKGHCTCLVLVKFLQVNTRDKRAHFFQ